MQTRHRSSRRGAPAAAVPRQRTNRYGLELQAALARDPHLGTAIAANPAAYAQDLTFDDPTPVTRPTSPVASLLAEAEVSAFTQIPSPIEPLFVHPDDVARALAHAEAAHAAQAVRAEAAEALASFEALTPKTEMAVFGAATQAELHDMLAAEEEEVAEEEVVVVPAGNGPQEEHVQTTAVDWVVYLTQPDKTEKGLLAAVGAYFRHERSMGRKVSTLRSRFSVLKKFWTHSSRGEQPPQITTVEECFVKWQKKDTTIQARTFSAQKYAALYRLHRNKETILWKALAAVGNSFATRGVELLALTWGDVIRVSDAAGLASYKIKYNRLKQQTSNSSESEYALLTSVEGRRFWLRLGTINNGLVHATWRSHNVDKTMFQKAHGVTLFANTGASLCQIKAYSGHKSDSVPQRYIDTSTTMKTVAATATTAAAPLTSIPSSLLGKRSSNPNSSASSTYNINISVTGDVSGSLGLFGKD
ncbi:hypothetical protein B484DRAFT_399060 [Ochromonadaceae sp. CCMP2298]|nr:hypothetical protein B484DRAFT_399060 [Ochromonadaceae sp. CCMP2298]